MDSDRVLKLALGLNVAMFAVEVAAGIVGNSMALVAEGLDNLADAATRADVIANLALIASGVVVLWTGVRAVDLIVGAAIGCYIIKEAFEILGDARRTTRA